VPVSPRMSNRGNRSVPTFVGLREHAAKRLRRPYNCLIHRGTIDLFPQGQGFRLRILCSACLAIFKVSGRGRTTGLLDPLQKVAACSENRNQRINRPSFAEAGANSDFKTALLFEKPVLSLDPNSLEDRPDETSLLIRSSVPAPCIPSSVRPKK